MTTTIELNGFVVRGQRLASMWMAADPGLFQTALGRHIHAGTINVRFETSQHERLAKPIISGQECMNPSYLRGMQKLLVVDCTLEREPAYIVGERTVGGETVTLEVIGDHIKSIAYDQPVTLLLDPAATPRSLWLPRR